MRLLDEIAGIGRDPVTGGYLRYAWTPPELQLREWFQDQAKSRSLAIEEDGNGNLFAFWGQGSGTVLTGSHFDSVPHGGAFDGPLGIVSAFLAVDLLRERGFQPRKPIGIAAFAEEEGARFGLACLGSRLLTGAIEPSVRLVDRDGVALSEVITPAGKRQDILDRIGCYIELHIEQGRALDRPVGVASAIWPHGRWRLDFTGEPNHAGTRQQGGAAAWGARHDRARGRQPQRHQRDPVVGDRLARRPRRGDRNRGGTGQGGRGQGHRAGRPRRHPRPREG
jgi:N-carbamoyl-L-amino-acid hydrolase